MKQIFFLITLLISFTSCKKVFKDDTQNTLIINNTDDLASAIAGLNYRFAYSIVGTPFYYYISFINSDDLAVVNGFQNCNEYLNLGALEYQTGPDYFWKSLYQTIISANNILNKALNLGRNNAEIRNMIGEVYFIRAYTYFRLVRYFGQVPIINDINVNYTVKKPRFKDIYNFILSDLQNAINLLPGSNKEARIPYNTPHRGTAKVLMAEVYLNMGGYPLKQPEMYSLAATTAKEVMDSAAYFGYGLLPDLANLWNGTQELNSESVYTLYFQDVDFNNEFEFTFNAESYNGAYLDFRIFLYSIAGIQLYKNFPDSYRKNITYRSQKILPDGWYSDTASLPKKINICDGGNDVAFKKNYNPFLSELLNEQKGRTVYLLRFARTLLTFAEAKARSGNMDASAYDAINQVRRRANKVDLFSPSKYDLQPGLTSEQFADSVVWERALEFCGEPESRSFDLLRLEMMGQLNKLKFPGQGSTSVMLVDPTTFFIPIPEADKVLNPNLN